MLPRAADRFDGVGIFLAQAKPVKSSCPFCPYFAPVHMRSVVDLSGTNAGGSTEPAGRPAVELGWWTAAPPEEYTVALP